MTEELFFNERGTLHHSTMYRGRPIAFKVGLLRADSANFLYYYADTQDLALYSSTV
jgi:hypothetical protein